jgi:hypothetical protein
MIRGATLMVARSPGQLASLEEEGQTRASAGDHQGRPYFWRNKKPSI